jgi:hypothetical protein
LKLRNAPIDLTALVLNAGQQLVGELYAIGAEGPVNQGLHHRQR